MSRPHPVTVPGFDALLHRREDAEAWINAVLATTDQVRFTLHLRVAAGRHAEAVSNELLWWSMPRSLQRLRPAHPTFSLTCSVDGEPSGPNLIPLGGDLSDTGLVAWRCGIEFAYRPDDRMAHIRLDWPARALSGEHTLDLTTIRRYVGAHAY